ncbi:substrate-binding periplasmic protein [Pseudoalteromonas xiamenensis]
MRYLIYFILFFVSMSAQADCGRIYKVGIGTNWPPYVMYLNDIPYGLDIEVTEAILRSAGLCYEFIKLPSSARGLNELEKGLVDVLPSASFNTERAKIAYFSIPYRRERMRLFSVNPDESAKNLSELFAGDNIFTANPGAYYGEELAEILRIDWYRKRLFEVASLDRRMQMVVLGRVNYLIEDEISGLYFAKQKGYNQIKLHSYIVNDNAIHFMLGRRSFSKEQVDAINEAIERQRYYFKTLEAKYISTTVESPTH